jgi:hypothetical protein
MAAMLCSPLMLHAQLTPGGNDIGSIPAAAQKGTKKTIHPGDCHTNGDGVKVCNGEASSGNATIDPKDGDEASATTVDTKSGFQGKIEGTDSNDTVNLGSGNKATVSGSGSTINVSGGSTITVQNAAGGGDMTVNLPSGDHVSVPAGSSVVVHT